MSTFLDWPPAGGVSVRTNTFLHVDFMVSLLGELAADILLAFDDGNASLSQLHLTEGEGQNCLVITVQQYSD